MGYGVTKGSQMSGRTTTGIGGSRPLWRVLYESAEITITSWYVDVDGIRIRVAELGDLTCCLSYRYPVIKMTAVVGGLELAIAAPLAIAAGAPVLICAGFVSACGLIIGLLCDQRRNPRYLEIHATLRGRRVVLFGTGDRREFGFVWRALGRAVEDNRQPLP